MIVKVEVTQEDIDKGEREKCTACPIARALQRVFNEDVQPQVFGQRIDIRKMGELMGYTCSNDVLRFVWAFDGFELVFPFTFDLEIPDSLAHLLREASGQEKP